MALEKFRTRLFITSRLTVSGELVLPYATSASTLAINGNIVINHVAGTAKMLVRSGGTTYTLALGTAVSNGSITLTSA